MFSGPVETRPQPGGIAIALIPDGRTIAKATANPKTHQLLLALVNIDGSNYRELDDHIRGSDGRFILGTIAASAPGDGSTCGMAHDMYDNMVVFFLGLRMGPRKG